VHFASRLVKNLTWWLWLAGLGVALVHAAPLGAEPAQQPAQSGLARPVGTIKSLTGNTIVLKTDAGPEVTIQVQDPTKFLRIAPGETDIKKAVPAELKDLQVNDRILAQGPLAQDGKTVVAIRIILVKEADLTAKHQQEIQDWQRRGVGGLVSAVDAITKTVTISVTSLAGTKTIAIRTTKDTTVRRYAPDSVKFDDAKPSTLEQIKPGDQLRARGNRSTDGNELTAEEIVTGAFRNIAGTISAIDSAAGTITVQDAISKKSIVVKITSDSQVRKLTPIMAQGIAMRLKGGAGAPGGANGGGSGGANTRPTSGSPQGQGGGRGGAGGGDFQQILSRLPPVTIADLEKGEAVMIVTTEGEASGVVTALTLLGGVDAILRAAPDSSPAILLSPWSLGGGGGEGG
jgi:hypothetical protein